MRELVTGARLDLVVLGIQLFQHFGYSRSEVMNQDSPIRQQQQIGGDRSPSFWICAAHLSVVAFSGIEPDSGRMHERFPTPGHFRFLKLSRAAPGDARNATPAKNWSAN